jgi:hypothetical protein
VGADKTAAVLTFYIKEDSLLWSTSSFDGNSFVHYDAFVDSPLAPPECLSRMGMTCFAKVRHEIGAPGFSMNQKNNAVAT